MHPEIKKVYDIRLEGDNIAVDLYDHTLTYSKKDGKNETFNSFKFLTTIYPEDLKACIADLLSKDYFSRLDFNYGMNELVTNNPLIKLKLMLLSSRNKILEAFYNPYAIKNNLNVLTTNITYINMYTGEIKQMELDNLGPVTESKIKALQAHGFIEITDSFSEKKRLANKVR